MSILCKSKPDTFELDHIWSKLTYFSNRIMEELSMSNNRQAISRQVLNKIDSSTLEHWPVKSINQMTKICPTMKWMKQLPYAKWCGTIFYDVSIDILIQKTNVPSEKKCYDTNIGYCILRHIVIFRLLLL